MEAPGAGSAPERAEAYRQAPVDGALSGHSIVWFYEGHPYPTSRLPGALKKYLCIAPFGALRQAAASVRAPDDVIVADGLLVVATTRKRIAAHLRAGFPEALLCCRCLRARRETGALLRSAAPQRR